MAVVCFITLGISQEIKTVGIVDGNEFIVTCNKQKILDYLNEHTNYEHNLSDVQISGERNRGTGEMYYFMLVTNSETSYFIAFELTLDKQTFKISSNSRTVNCSGCDSGCSPKQDEEGNWMCSPGCGFNPITSNPRCNKSETIVVKQFVQLAIVAA